MKRRWRRNPAAIIGVCFAAYAGSYLWLSVSGRYEPAVIGLNGVKWYKWAPKGFVTDYKENLLLRNFFAPLWLLDTRLWHTMDDAYDGRYPINEVRKEDIGKVYEAWQ